MFITLVGCASSTKQARPPSDQAMKAGADVAVFAMALMDTPYRYGAQSASEGFDCSGLIVHTYRSVLGLSLPRTVAQMQTWGKAVEAEARIPGDLILFAPGPGGRSPTHGGIYVGQNRFVHAPSTGGKVRLDSLKAPYWNRQHWIVRRP
jgi:cell wall-associated NlpC family hydrolase